MLAWCLRSSSPHPFTQLVMRCGNERKVPTRRAPSSTFMIKPTVTRPLVKQGVSIHSHRRRLLSTGLDLLLASPPKSA